jgi:hypothetical protein
MVASLDVSATPNVSLQTDLTGPGLSISSGGRAMLESRNKMKQRGMLTKRRWC